MIWILRIFYILIQCLTAFSVGDIAVHALSYEMTKSLIIRNVLLLLFCVFGYFVLERIERRGHGEGDKSQGITTAVFDLMIYVVVTVLAVVLAEVYYGNPDSKSIPTVTITGLVLLLVMLAGRRIWTGINASHQNPSGQNDVIYIIFNSIKYLAGIAFGVLIMVSLRAGENRLYIYLSMAGCAVVAVILGILMPSGNTDMLEQNSDSASAVTEKAVAAESADGSDDMEDFDSWEYWERREREELERRRSKKLKLICFGCVTLAVTTFLFFVSPIIGSVYLLSAFLIGVVIPMAFNKFAAGGREEIERKTALTCSVVFRVFQVILLLLLIWQLSYGAIWEYQFLMALGANIITEEYLLV